MPIITKLSRRIRIKDSVDHRSIKSLTKQRFPDNVIELYTNLNNKVDNKSSKETKIKRRCKTILCW